MIDAHARLETQNGSKYVQQLCKHFAHKVDVTFDANHGECRFSCGTAILDADPDSLTLTVQAADAEQLAETKQVIESHLIRFGFRENIAPLSWH